MKSNPCLFSDLPRRNYQPAAICSCDFDAVSRRLGVEAERFFLKEGPGAHSILAVKLGTGRFATLCRWDSFPGTIEVGLELVRDMFFYESDLQAVLMVLDIDGADVSRQQGDFKWK